MVVVMWQVVRAIQDKVCEGRMQMWDVKGSRWRPVYTVVTDADVFVYDMQARHTDGSHLSAGTSTAVPLDRAAGGGGECLLAQRSSMRLAGG